MRFQMIRVSNDNFSFLQLLYKETADEKTKLEQLVLIEEFSQQAGVQSSK